MFQPHAGGKGGWFLGEAPKHDVEMANAVIEVMVEASQHAAKGYS